MAFLPIISKKGKGVIYMGGTFTSLGALKAALKKEVEEAMQETMEKSYKDAKDNVGNFYAAPEGDYSRTGTLKESPTMSVSGMSGELSLNTGAAYSPAGRDTNTIYNYAEGGGLLGNGGFWNKTKSDVEKNIQESFGKRFN